MGWFRPTVRLRLTLLLSGLFLVSGLFLLVLVLVLFRESLQRLPSVTPQDLLRQARGDSSGRELAQLLREIRLEERATATSQILRQAVIALTITTLGVMCLGWIVSGQLLRPLRDIIEHVRGASEISLDSRVRLEGPEDEFKDLADTYDALLDRLQAAFESQRRFAAEVSHELRTPLAIIHAEAEVMLSAPDATERERQAGSTIRAVVMRNERLIDGLLALSRAESTMIDQRPVDVAELAGNVVGDSLQLADARRIAINLSLQDRDATVNGDPVLLGQMLSNLVQNAIRHNVDDGWVSVRVEETPEHDQVEVVVRNGGPVLAEDPESLFIPFRRGRGVSSQGAGLGLPIVRAVAHAHHGSVTATAREEGGLEMVVRLPMASAAGAKSQP